MNPNNLRMISQTIAQLKREYGVAGDLYTLSGQTIDLQTGAVVGVRFKIHVPRMVVLPINLTTQMFIKGGFIRASPSHAQAGQEIVDTVIIIDRKDLSAAGHAFIFQERIQYVVVDHTRYNLGDVQDFSGKAVILTVKHVAGANPNEIFDISVHQRLIINQNVTYANG